MSKGTCTLSLVARNGDRKTVTAWEVDEIASLPGGEPPEDIDEQFPGLRYLSEPNCLIQKAGPIHVLLGMDHAHLMPEHVAENTDLGSQLRLMSSMFGGQASWAKERHAYRGSTQWMRTKGTRRPLTDGRREKIVARWHKRQGKRHSSIRTSCREGYGTMERKSPIPR